MLRTAYDIETKVRPSGITVVIPKGMRVRPIPRVPRFYWLDEFPVNVFPPNSFERHDAIHYGIWIGAADIEDRPA